MINILNNFFSSLNDSITTEENLFNSDSTHVIQNNLFKYHTDLFINNLVEFVYSGAYTEYFNRKEESSRLISSEINSIYENISLISDGTFQNKMTELFQEVDKIIVESTENCLFYFLETASQFNNFKHTLIYRDFTFIDTHINSLKELFEYCNIFLLEYFISEEITYYEKLLEIENRINLFHKSYTFNKLKLIESKVAFLKYKWKKRQKYNRIFLIKNVDSNYSKKYIFKNDEVDLSKKILLGEEFYTYFKNWIDRIELHYFDQDNQEVLTTYENCSNFNEDSIKNNFDFFYHIKYNKDFTLDLDWFERIKNKVKSSNIDRKNKLYFLNNYFSILITNKNAEISKIEKEFNEIKNFSTINQSNNYFIYYKMLSYKINKILDLTKLNKLTANYLQEYLTECNTLIKESSKKIEWTYTSFNTLFQFDKSDCLIDIDNDKVFFPTSFLLSISITENKYLIEEKKDIIKDLKYKLIELKNSNYNQTIEKQIKENEKKSIETISLFTAVISFVIGSISGFTFVDNIYNAIAFTIIFGICLSIFLILILKLVRKDDSYNILEFLPIFILLSILVFVALSLSEKNVVTKENLKDQLIKLNVIDDK